MAANGVSTRSLKIHTVVTYLAAISGVRVRAVARVIAVVAPGIMNRKYA